MNDAQHEACPACGAPARRETARFCAICGRDMGDSYRPADAVRASYHAWRRATSAKEEVAPGRRARVGAIADPVDGAARTALAFAAYALVPYLGILFCPGAIIYGGISMFRARRATGASHLHLAALSVALGLLILYAQLFLWWLLYKAPEWAGL
jgi:hypothetical protein